LGQKSMSQESLKAAGERASSPLWPFGMVSSTQANIDSSSEIFVISVCNRRKAFSPSPYNNVMLTPKIPRRQYAMSSSLNVSRLEAQDIFCATDAVSHPNKCSILVIAEINVSKLLLVPISSQLELKNTTFLGASNS